jgi:hypothetical protein
MFLSLLYDLPISLATDTLLLPYDLLKSPKQEPPPDTAAPSASGTPTNSPAGGITTPDSRVSGLVSD